MIPALGQRIPDTFAHLLGDWALQRTIADHRSGSPVTFTGNAAVRQLTGDSGPPSRRARYVEAGRLRSRGHAGPARRVLTFTQAPDGSVHVSFTDGRPFITLDLGDGAWRGEHPCGPDHYALEFALRAGDVIEERWRVRGPAKDYAASTTWRRIGTPAAPLILKTSQARRSV